ncbi:beta-ketoacyl-ACP synthase III [Clostridium sp. DL1XJH146]
MFNAKIISTGSYVPENIMTNKDLSKIVETSDEWITDRTGIKERRISINETTSMLAIKAAIDALNNSNIKSKEIDLIIVATATPDYFFPSTACLVQKEIGAIKATCFDLSAACTGFIFALNTATQFLKTGQFETALIIGAETLSKVVDWEDRKTCVLFADGAGAVLLKRSEKQGIISAYTGSDGNGYKNLTLPAIAHRNTFLKEVEKKESYISMNGGEIYKFAVRIIAECIQKLLEKENILIDEIKFILPHQANLKIIEASAKKLKIDKDRFFVNLDNYGNTSGASIPLALDEMVRNNLLNDGDLIILVGFGAGLTYGAQLIRWFNN